METNTETDNTTQSEPEVERVTPHEHASNTGWAVVAYIIFFLPLLTDAKDDPFVKFHVKQGFVVFLTGVTVTILSIVPPIMVVAWILHIGVIILAILGIINALNHREEELPLIGHFADRFKF